jgi:tRNA1Val (adenine37-N6)-methyltransferase
MRRPNRARDSSKLGVAATQPVRDALFSGEVLLWQPARGYRVNVDSLLLADFAAARRPEARHVFDLGAGVGAVTLAYAHLASVKTCTLIEREQALAALAERNLDLAHVRGRVLPLDLTQALPDALRGLADIVVSNPPFFPRGTSSPPDGVRSRARSGALEPFLRAAAMVMGRRAYAFFAYPSPALSEIMAAARTNGRVAKRLRLVHAFRTTPARLALLELRRAKPGGLVIEPPIVEWAEQGVRSQELDALVKGAGPARRRRGDTG